MEQLAGKVLKRKHVLVVEDDAALAKRIAELFSTLTGEDVSVAHSMEAAKNAAAICSGSFDLVVMDVMLPANEKHFGMICKLEQRLAELTDSIRRINPVSATVDDKLVLAEARQNRAQALAEIQKLTVKDGGIQLARDWRANGPESVRRAPILFLTAVGNEKDVTDGLAAATGSGSWLVKPVASEEIIKASVSLLVHRQTER